MIQNDLLLKYSFHDRLLAETVHTVEMEKKIVSEVLAGEYPFVPEDLGARIYVGFLRETNTLARGTG